MKLNYSAEQIMHVYKQLKKENKEALSKCNLPYKIAFGNIYFQIEDVFTDTNTGFLNDGQNYGGVIFLGNINGKGERQLFFKSLDIKKQIDSLRFLNDYVREDVSNAIKIITEAHGQPKPQYCHLFDMA